MLDVVLLNAYSMIFEAMYDAVHPILLRSGLCCPVVKKYHGCHRAEFGWNII